MGWVCVRVSVSVSVSVGGMECAGCPVITQERSAGGGEGRAGSGWEMRWFVFVCFGSSTFFF